MSITEAHLESLNQQKEKLKCVKKWQHVQDEMVKLGHTRRSTYSLRHKYNDCINQTGKETKEETLNLEEALELKTLKEKETKIKSVFTSNDNRDIYCD